MCACGVLSSFFCLSFFLFFHSFVCLSVCLSVCLVTKQFSHFPHSSLTRSGDELLLTEMIFNGVFNHLTTEQSVALLSCFICEERVCTYYWVARDVTTAILGELQQKILHCSFMIATQE